MDAEMLEQAGLNQNQAKGYLALVSSGKLTPPQLATKVGITRTNAYEMLNRLVELGLAMREDVQKKFVYRPSNPVALEKLVERRRESVLQQEQRLRGMMPQLLSYFYTFSDQPGVRMFQGREGIIKVYEDTLRTRQPILLVRSRADDKFMSLEFLAKYTAERAKLGIKTVALWPGQTVTNPTMRDEGKALVERHAIAPEKYSAPVEIDVYGDKVAFISFGEEAMATIIESPQIAEAMRQVFALALPE